MIHLHLTSKLKWPQVLKLGSELGGVYSRALRLNLFMYQMVKVAFGENQNELKEDTSTFALLYQ